MLVTLDKRCLRTYQMGSISGETWPRSYSFLLKWMILKGLLYNKVLFEHTHTLNNSLITLTDF